MRIDLVVTYAQKDEAKRGGARWDAARKVWYLENPGSDQLQRLVKFVPESRGGPRKQAPSRPAYIPVANPVLSASECPSCLALPPWEPCCLHGDGVLSGEQLEHIRSITQGNP